MAKKIDSFISVGLSLIIQNDSRCFLTLLLLKQPKLRHNDDLKTTFKTIRVKSKLDFKVSKNLITFYSMFFNIIATSLLKYLGEVCFE